MRGSRSFVTLGVAAALFAASNARAQSAAQHAVRPDGFLSRVELLALMQTLNASLLASRSATAVLENWCAAHHMAPQPKIAAVRATGAGSPPSDETRKRLGVSADEVVKHRHVRLTCGDHVLSEADNWYVPARLPEEANRLLETSDTPFGKAVQALQPFRRTYEVTMKWSPLPQGWEMGAAPQAQTPQTLDIPHELFEHRAVLYDARQTPFSEVRETYTSEIFDFDAAASR